MMEDAAVFSVLSKCFAPVDEDDWRQIARGAAWSDFLDGVRRLLQDDGSFGASAAPLTWARRRCPLQEFLSNAEVSALFAPPTYEEKCAFAARHFTGGLPESAVPVESLYVPWTVEAAHGSPFSRVEGLYMGDSARYMADLVASLGLEVPPTFASCADHLALELDLAAVMLRSGMRDEARRFVVERFGWLTAYRTRLLSLQDDARFYLALVDVLLGIRTQIASAEPNALVAEPS